MQKITRDSILKLLDQKVTHPAVTIYMPTHRVATSPNVTEDTIRFKNLIHEAVEMIQAESNDKKVAKALCSQLEEKIDDMSFWESRTEGLLICAQPDFLGMYSLPIDTEEYVGVDTQFHLAPLLGMLHDSKEYYVLALAQQNPILYKGDEYGLEMLDIGLPASINEGLNIDEPNQQSEHQRSAGGGSLNTSQFNGRGGARDPHDSDRMTYFYQIDRLLNANLERDVPLILAGIDSETVEFKAISKYPSVLQGTIAGNFTNIKMKDGLFEKAYAIVREELVEAGHVEALEEYERLRGMSRVAGDEKQIIEAANMGRVDTLFVSMIQQTRDTIRDNMETVARLTFPDRDVAKKVNDMAMKVWRMSGKVICLDYARIPKGAPMVATLRY
jgi:hypothetical protein